MSVRLKNIAKASKNYRCILLLELKISPESLVLVMLTAIYGFIDDHL